MQLFSVSPQSSSTVRPAPQQDHEPTEPKGCGWYDSSFELASGLEISEQDDDLLYQLCEFCLH